jgi:hypothetical protein
MALRRLQIDFEALAEAMRNQGRNETEYYLDTTTGCVLNISTEVWNALEEGRHIAGSLSGWQQEELREAREVFGDTQGRYIPIPERAEWELEELMTDFADTVTDDGLRQQLTDALDGRDAVRQFRELLAQYPEERQRWLAFKRTSDREYVTRWLEGEEIEPVWGSAPASQERA